MPVAVNRAFRSRARAYRWHTERFIANRYTRDATFGARGPAPAMPLLLRYSDYADTSLVAAHAEPRCAVARRHYQSQHRLEMIYAPRDDDHRRHLQRRRHIGRSRLERPSAALATLLCARAMLFHFYAHGHVYEIATVARFAATFHYIHFTLSASTPHNTRKMTTH